MTLQEKIHYSNQIADAIQRNEGEYATWSLTKPIKLPSPQVHGTMTQRRSYAVGKAMSLIEEYDGTTWESIHNDLKNNDRS
tara:strand:+ start:353 stop:595 length:243 start_codon:yes stop_codon:yes gene_type:complete